MVAFRHAAEKYLHDRVALGELSRDTARTIRYHLDMLATTVGDLEIGELRRTHIENWLIAQQVAPATKYARLVSARGFTRWCYDHHLCRVDACAGLRGPRKARPVPRALSAGDVARVLDTTDARAGAVVLLGAQEGLRRAEIAGLSTHDLDPSTRIVRVCGKRDRERYVPVSDETWAAIDRYLTDCPAGPGWPLFRCYTFPARALSARRVGDIVTAVMRDAGVKVRARDGKSLHALRHTCANDMLDRGADLRDVSEMLGHASLAVTADVYARRLVVLARLRVAASGRSYTHPARGMARSIPKDHGLSDRAIPPSAS